MRDEIITFAETVTWHVRLAYDETKFDGIKLARAALIHLREEELSAIEVGESSGLTWCRTESFRGAEAAPPRAIEPEEIIERCGYTNEAEFYHPEKRKEITPNG